MLKIAVILGSTRPGRNGKAVADWVVDQAQRRANAEYELIDLLDFPLPHFDEPMSPKAGLTPAGDHTKTWAAAMRDVREPATVS
jgi:NAD(P)H-dependent FMN reductase